MKFCAIAVFLLIFSCKVSDNNLLGTYNTNSYRRSAIVLDSNKKFKFWNDGLEFLLTNESFLFTQGSWQRSKRNRILLNSISDSIAIPSFGLKKLKLNNSNKSKFVFMDNKKDTVLIYTVYNNNENIFYRSHGPFLTGFEGSVAKSDTLTFTFTYGFKPVQILIEESDPMEYIIILNREFRSKYFLNSEYIIRKRKLIRVNDKVKFRKLKSRAV